MFKNWIFSAAILAASFVVGSCGSVPSPASPAPFKKSATPFNTKLIKFESPLPFSEVTSRLTVALNKTGAVGFAPKFNALTTHDEQVAMIQDVTQGRNFLYFLETPHKKWLDVFDPATPHPEFIVYTLGNPGFAANIIPLDYLSGLYIPPRVAIIAKLNGQGTEIMYPECASIMAPFTHSPELQKNLKDLDSKLVELFSGILSQ